VIEKTGCDPNFRRPCFSISLLYGSSLVIRYLNNLYAKHFKTKYRPLSALERGVDSAKLNDHGSTAPEIVIGARPSSKTLDGSTEHALEYFQYIVDEDQGHEMREADRKTPEYQAMISRLAKTKAPKRS
jgi:hypothetical protein